jgi:hypothetical protein
VVRFWHAEGTSQSEIYRGSPGVYGQYILKDVSVWCSKFKDSRTTQNDDAEERRGRPSTSHTGENCVIVEGSITEE